MHVRPDLLLRCRAASVHKPRFTRRQRCRGEQQSHNSRDPVPKGSCLTSNRVLMHKHLRLQLRCHSARNLSASDRQHGQQLGVTHKYQSLHPGEFACRHPLAQHHNLRVGHTTKTWHLYFRAIWAVRRPSQNNTRHEKSSETVRHAFARVGLGCVIHEIAFLTSLSGASSVCTESEEEYRPV